MSGGARRDEGERAAESHQARVGDEPANAAPPPASVWRGRGGRLALEALINEQSDRTLAELQQALGTSASLATIWRAIEGLAITIKKPVRASE